MNSEETRIHVTDEDYGFLDEGLTLRYTEKVDDGDQKLQRYQVFHDMGIVYSGEKIWRTEEKGGLFGFFKDRDQVYADNVQKRIAHDPNRQSVITEETSWDEFRDFLTGTEAEEYWRKKALCGRTIKLSA